MAEGKRRTAQLARKTANPKIPTTILSTRVYRGTEEKLRVVLETYARTGRLKEAFRAADIAPSQHYDRIKVDPVYAAAVENAERVVSQEIEDTVYDLAIAGDMQAATLLLKRFRPELYRERVSMDTTLTIALADRMTAANERLLTLRRAESETPKEPEESDSEV